MMGGSQNEELLSVGFDAYMLIKTGDIEWGDNIIYIMKNKIAVYRINQ